MKKGGLASLVHPLVFFALVFVLLVSGLSAAMASPDEEDLSEGIAGNAVIPEYPESGHVVDAVDALTPAEEESINQQIDSLKAQTQNNINVDVYLYSNSFVDSGAYTNQIADSWYADNAHQGDNSTLIAVNMALNEGYINTGPQTEISDDQKLDIVINRMGPHYLRGENFKGTQVGIDQVYKVTMKAEADRQAAAMQDQIKRTWLILLIVGAVLMYLSVVGYFVIRRRRARYRFADAQIYDALSANPGLEVSDEMRNAYRSYRAYYRHDPAVGQIAYNARLRTKSIEDEQPYTFYVPDFEQWLPLYQKYPELYSGKGRNPDGRFS